MIEFELVCAVACALGAGLMYAGLLPDEPGTGAVAGTTRPDCHPEAPRSVSAPGGFVVESPRVRRHFARSWTRHRIVAQVWLGWPLVSLVFAVCGVGLPAARYAPRARRQRAAEQAALVEFAAQPGACSEAVGPLQWRSRTPDCLALVRPALRPELARTVRDMRRLPGGFPEALDRLRDRLADPVADQVVTASKHSYRLGGRGLGTLLDRLVESSRQTQDVRREAESRKTQAYLAAGDVRIARDHAGRGTYDRT